MKRGMKLWMLLTLVLPCAAMAQQTLYVARVTPNSALVTEVARDERAAQLGRVVESVDDHLVAAIVASRKFRVVERSDALEELIREQGYALDGLVATRGAEVNAMIGADLALFVTLDAFQQETETATFNNVRRAKCRYQLSAQMRLVNTSTAEVVEASNVQLEDVAVMDVTASSNRPQGRFDAMLPKLTRALAEKSVKQLIAAAFPPKVIDVDGDVVTINAGDDVFKVGDRCKLYGKTRTVTDPDTGATHKIKGRFSGELRIIDVDADYAQGELIGDARATVGAQVKPIAEK